MACSSRREEGGSSSWQPTGKHSISECQFSPIHPLPFLSLSKFSPPLSLFGICCLNSSESWSLNCHHYASHATPSGRERKKGVVGTWGEGVESKQWLSHPSMLLPGNFFLHMTALSDSRPPFRTKREGEERSREQHTDEWWSTEYGTGTLSSGFEQHKATLLNIWTKPQ